MIPRMEKLQTVSVQKVTLEAETFAALLIIKKIPNDGMTDGRQVNADLMSYSGFHPNL